MTREDDFIKATAMITIRKYDSSEAEAAMEIWNSVVREGIAFPQLEELTEDTASRWGPTATRSSAN